VNLRPKTVKKRNDKLHLLIFSPPPVIIERKLR